MAQITIVELQVAVNASSSPRTAEDANFQSAKDTDQEGCLRVRPSRCAEVDWVKMRGEAVKAGPTAVLYPLGKKICGGEIFSTTYPSSRNTHPSFHSSSFSQYLAPTSLSDHLGTHVVACGRLFID